ncbi:MAG: adenosylmethionine decarboxylase [Candidatus Aenigmarchaeota archaeon]|nr:adenosylmethionine decarboxylase [Candidatus Aenigmarchaeota archaeon]
MDQPTFGPHVTIDAGDCDFEKLTDYQFIYDLLTTLPEQIGMTRMTLPYVVRWKDKWAQTPGISGFVMLAESHISIHTFPEQNYVFIDIFSCREFDTQDAAQRLVAAFGAKDVHINLVKRGLNFDRARCFSARGEPEKVVA